MQGKYYDPRQNPAVIAEQMNIFMLRLANLERQISNHGGDVALLRKEMEVEVEVEVSLLERLKRLEAENLKLQIESNVKNAVIKRQQEEIAALNQMQSKNLPSKVQQDMSYQLVKENGQLRAMLACSQQEAEMHKRSMAEMCQQLDKAKYYLNIMSQSSLYLDYLRDPRADLQSINDLQQANRELKKQLAVHGLTDLGSEMELEENALLGIKRLASFPMSIQKKDLIAEAKALINFSSFVESFSAQRSPGCESRITSPNL